MLSAVLANTGYFVGIGIEAFIIIVCAVLLALMLTGLLFKWIADGKVKKLVRTEAKAAAKEAKAVADEEAAAQAAAQAEADRARMEEEAKVKAEAEAAAAEAAAVAAAKKAEEDAKKQAEEEAKMKAEAEAKKQAEAEAAAQAAQTEKQTVKERIVEKVVIVEQQKAEPAAEAQPAQPAPVQPAPAAVAEAAATEDEDAENENGFVVVQDGIVFNDSKTITELYDELSPEQQSYFDELREEALTKPDAELAISKNFVTVKIGKRNLIKLLIKRGVTVAEFIVENDALKQLRLSNMNKRGKSAIKVKPTVVQVIDLDSLKVAVDMINLAYEELMLGD